MAMTGIGFMELVLVLLSFGGPFNQMLGMPPGERDQSLVHAAAEDSLVYLEWSARGEGEPGAEGVDGLAADPEIRAFFDSVRSSIEGMIVREAGPMGDTFKVIPELVLTLTGKPGCLFIGFDDSAPVAEGMPTQFAIMMALRAGFVVNAGDQADAVSDHIKGLLKLGMGQEIESLDHTALPSPSPVEVHRHEDYIILGVGPGTVDSIVERITANAGGIAKNETFAAGWKDLEIERVGLVSFFDIENGVKKIGTLSGMGPQIENTLQMAGVEGLQYSMSVTGVVDGQVVTNGHLKGLKGENGLMALASGRGISPDDFAMVPADSDVVLAYSADSEKIIAAIKQFAGTMDPNGAEDVAEGLQMFNDQVGLNLETDVFGVLDQVITVSNSPGDGGLIASSPVVTVGLKDRPGAVKSVAKLAGSLERLFANSFNGNQWRRRGVTLEQREFMGTEIHMINTVGDDMVIAPAWCLTDSHLMIALHPQPLKSRIRRAKDDGWKSYGDKFAGGPDGETIVFTSSDMQSVLPRLYGLVPWMAQIVYSEMQSGGFETNLLDFPSATGLLPYMTNSKAYLVRTDDGIRRQSEGPPIVGGLPSLLPSMTPMMFIAGVRQQRMDVQAMQAVEADIVIEEAAVAE